ncbi:MAG TPA: hypothetical protein DCQ26_16655 [Marinilabiliales bacterium]|jgi:acyl-ACP thioesterase|nr:MAG: hypothetical protein A2W95_00800 [Bacteroidetes bacterium GWA2_40_14]OFX59317.1 MAG: hypothetical protein A2W84_02395 [Bacteroidetes bacterium GWC2_40_13]OFX74712.1 MAG: hypothetical protein A2W96_04405 [Bacteroidetes bacterium GWD2_40_43]OFX88462.1 MAG: hypothetical protein A2W97_09580 [Bacteroidetes bacterium GWE2_40_63]OFY22620.1 MAG: hypothetical protein A2W88_11325 [Bacteroidetes bacterium GWF2_40_13]OFZ29566.1 MAG: hypothetical protein A2437_08685 [Bacteroidetes bacterium RIFOXYC
MKPTAIQLSEKDLTLFLPYKVTSAETDMFGRLRLGALANLLIQSAINSADSLGFGFGGLRQQRLFWVLSRLTVDIYEPLYWYQSGAVETWPKDLEKILYLRDFKMLKSENKLVAVATSGWLAIDLENKRPKTIEGLDAQFFEALKDKHALTSSPEKLFPVKEGEPFTVKSGFFDIDLNKHVTSSRYVDWMMDTFSLNFHEKNYPKKLSINFMKETMPGETIQLMRFEAAPNEFHFEGNNLSSQTIAFRGKIVF